jgi:hypothetical protein
MKKLLLAMSLFVAAKTQAQWTQNFNTGIPSNWIQIKNDNNIPVSSYFGTVLTPALTNNAYANYLSATADSSLITPSYFSPTGAASRWIITHSFTVPATGNPMLSWYDYTPTTGNDFIKIMISPTAGTTASSFTATLFNGQCTNDFTKRGVSLATYAGQTVRLAFVNENNNKRYFFLDDVAVENVANTLDASMEAITFPRYAANNTKVSVTVSNAGVNAITSLTVNYKIGANAAVSQTFTGLNLMPFQATTLSFTTLASGITAGALTITGTITQVNGVADPNAANNVKTANFTGASQGVARSGLIEEFSSSTCPPCATFNATFDPLIVSNNSNAASSKFNVVKYQMNWPSPGTDPSYNAHGLARRTYYSVSGIPDHFTNGLAGGAGDQAEIDASKANPAVAAITGTYFLKGADSIICTVTVTPYITTTTPFKLHVAAVERQYNFTGTTTQTNYVRIMRMMFPDGNGTTLANLTAGQSQSFTFRAKYTVGNVTQNSLNFWGNPIGSDLVAFVQDNTNKDVIQSFATPASTTSVNSIENITSLSVFPNPAVDYAEVGFRNTVAMNVGVRVFDMMGKMVFEKAATTYESGLNAIQIPVNQFSNGLYNVQIITNNGTLTEKITVAK